MCEVSPHWQVTPASCRSVLSFVSPRSQLESRLVRRTQTASAWPLPGRHAGRVSTPAAGRTSASTVRSHILCGTVLHRLMYTLQRSSALLLQVPNNHHHLFASEKCSVPQAPRRYECRTSHSFVGCHPCRTSRSDCRLSGPDDRCLRYSAVLAPGRAFTSMNAGARRRVAEGLIQDPESGKKGVGRGVAREWELHGHGEREAKRGELQPQEAHRIA